MKIVDGFKICGYDDDNAKSGITAVFPMKENVASVYVAGGSPGTRDTEVIDLEKRKNHEVNAISIVGRSIYGLKAVEGIVDSLRKDNIGFKINNIIVPIVPSAVIFDFYYNNILPDETWGIKCYKNMSQDVKIGNYWAGKGATVGKLMGLEYMMKSGQGYYKEGFGKVEIGVLTVVNAIGEIINEKGEIIAGVNMNGKIIPSQEILKKKLMKNSSINTTVSIVMTNIKASVEEMKLIAKSAYLGISRRIRPIGLSLDGDVVFSVTTNEVEEDIDTIRGLVEDIASKSVLSIWGG
ncbi:L-aminopeptidase/D-esterase [Caldisphaera lagunensis DSM 15908]|uniref:L-aminopeptidase/D-esterase n=1 Tax=Caldisphaera lagunensis (strain DSM 15908 / JCM 11604 / ANMR 0165 / IC-154) TaxID=1056495 RepID=L0AA08_CALLD|nr:P1 family peptidase [Caldisphaera lagunensis]AFZ69967.1 L-aminopeptidase/D-esterase [Caldisphaera lagunensis DSM 15908]